MSVSLRKAFPKDRPRPSLRARVVTEVTSADPTKILRLTTRWGRFIINPMSKDKGARKKNLYTETQVGTILEEILSQQKAIFQGLDFIKSKIESLETTVARTWVKVTEIDLRLVKVEKKVEEIDAR
ncbi:MAG: hypothetical protein JW847_04040, partial [Candidatus Omnitrophica bacterium]|nr:hypothetical protein [Candidatus Omnitrophota bacterium]